MALATVASALLAMQSTLGLDYAQRCQSEFCDDPSAAIAGLAHGHPGAFFHSQPTMGPVSILLRAPFAALAQLGSDSALAQYRLGAFACMLATSVVIVWLATVAARRGVHPVICVLFAAGLLVNPLTFRALALGHPEEPLAAVLSVGAIVAAADRRVVAGGVMLGLAMATKQWALLAAGPMLLAAPGPARRTAAIWAAATALLVFAPLVIGDLQRFRDATSEAASPHANATPTNIWWPLADRAPDASLDPGADRRRPPSAVRTASHWLVLVLAFGGSLAVYARTREPSLEVALGLAALIFLLRCLLDPYTFSYHHWPFLVALASYDVIGRRRFPLLAVTAGALLWYMSYHLSLRQDPDALLHLYLAWTIPFAGVLLWLTARAPRRRTRSP